MRWWFLVLAACGGGGGDEPLFDEGYRSSYVEVRNCRSSGDHDLNKVRILADPTALNAYTTRAMPFPVGSIVLKEEYDFSDGSCAGPIIEWTVMKKLDATTWDWQRVTKDRDVAFGDEEPSRCINCHTQCGKPPDGHDGTCAIPP